MKGTGGAVGLVRVPVLGKTTAPGVTVSLCFFLAREELFCSLVIRNVVIFGICGEKKAKQMQKGERGEQKMHRKQEAREELGQLQVNKTKGATDDTPPPPPPKKKTGKNETKTKTKTKTKKASSTRLQTVVIIFRSGKGGRRSPRFHSTVRCPQNLFFKGKDPFPSPLPTAKAKK